MRRTLLRLIGATVTGREVFRIPSSVTLSNQGPVGTLHLPSASAHGGSASGPRRTRTRAPAGIPDRLKDAAPRNLVSSQPQPEGWLPSWPDGPFIPSWEFPELRGHLRQVADLARDAGRYRKGHNRTRVEVAEKAGLNEETYGDFEAGRTWLVTAAFFRKVDSRKITFRLVRRQSWPGLDRRQW